MGIVAILRLDDILANDDVLMVRRAKVGSGADQQILMSWRVYYGRTYRSSLSTYVRADLKKTVTLTNEQLEKWETMILL